MLRVGYGHGFFLRWGEGGEHGPGIRSQPDKLRLLSLKRPERPGLVFRRLGGVGYGLHGRIQLGGKVGHIFPHAGKPCQNGGRICIADALTGGVGKVGAVHAAASLCCFVAS